MKRCIACGAPLWETPLLTLDNMPASAQHMPDAEHVGADKGLTLDLCQCSGCGLVQFDCETCGLLPGCDPCRWIFYHYGRASQKAV